jgi:hypothetical protein
VRLWRDGRGGAAGDPAGEPAGVSERAPEQELDLGVGAAQFVAGPAGQGVVDGGVEPQQDALALAQRAASC